jgi:hypothetical protein
MTAKLQLPSVTLLTVTAVNIDQTHAALLHCTAQADFGAVKMLCSALPSSTDPRGRSDVACKSTPIKRRDLMSDDLSAEFESYRMRLRTEEEKQAFDRKIKQLLQERGVDYVRGYVDGLKDNISK